MTGLVESLASESTSGVDWRVCRVRTRSTYTGRIRWETETVKTDGYFLLLAPNYTKKKLGFMSKMLGSFFVSSLAVGVWGHSESMKATLQERKISEQLTSGLNHHYIAFTNDEIKSTKLLEQSTNITLINWTDSHKTKAVKDASAASSYIRLKLSPSLLFNELGLQLTMAGGYYPDEVNKISNLGVELAVEFGSQ